jgi:hypothetical protein
MKIACLVAAAVSLTAGCSLQIVSLQPVKNRASVDLGCPAEQIEATVLDRKQMCVGNDDICATSAVAKGCGQQTVYVRVVGDGESTPWIRNGDIRPVPGGAAAPPAASSSASAPPK